MTGGLGAAGAAGGPGEQAQDGRPWRRCPLPAGPHLPSAAWPNKPALFRVTFDVVPTGSHTSPNPAKICAKLNQSILEMALVSCCQREPSAGDAGIRRGEQDVRAGGTWGALSLPNTSKAAAASGEREGGSRTHTRPSSSGGPAAGRGGQARVPGSAHLCCSSWPARCLASMSPHYY